MRRSVRSAIVSPDPVVTLPASEASLCAAWADFGCPLPGELYDEPDMQRIVSGLPSAFWNAVYRARFTPDDVDLQIERALEPFKVRGLAAFWWVTSSSQPADLGARLQAHGLVPAGIVTDMSRDLTELPDVVTPAGLTIEEVRNADMWHGQIGNHGRNTADEIPPLRDAVDLACHKVDRDPASLVRTIRVGVSLPGQEQYSWDDEIPIRGSTDEIAVAFWSLADEGIAHIMIDLQPETPASIETIGRVIEVMERGR